MNYILCFLLIFPSINSKLLQLKDNNRIGNLYYQNGLWNINNIANIKQYFKNQNIYLQFLLWDSSNQNKILTQFTLNFELDQRTNIIEQQNVQVYLQQQHAIRQQECQFKYEVKNFNEKNQLIPFYYIAKKKKIVVLIQSFSKDQDQGLCNLNYQIEAIHDRFALSDYYFIIAHILLTIATFFGLQLLKYKGISEIEYIILFMYECAEIFNLGVIFVLHKQIPNPVLEIYFIGLVVIAVLKFFFIFAKKIDTVLYMVGDENNNFCLHWILALPFLFGYEIFVYNQYNTLWFFLYPYFMIFSSSWNYNDNYIIVTFLITIQQTYPLIVIKLLKQNFAPLPNDIIFAIIFMLCLFLPFIIKAFKNFKLNNIKQTFQQEPLLNQLQPNELALFECSICMENGRLKPQRINELKDEDGLKLPCCNNPIHKMCIKSWIGSGKTTCVFCRRDLGFIKNI